VLWRYECLSCGEQIEEHGLQRYAKQKVTKAYCKSCTRAIIFGTESMMNLCHPCKAKGLLRAPYKSVNGIEMCGGCLADYEEKQRMLRLAPPLSLPEAKESPDEERNDMPEKCFCGRPSGHTGRHIGVKLDGTKTAAAKTSTPATTPLRDGPAEGKFGVYLSPAGMDAIWNTLPPGKKAELLERL
jgi:hypothetical protein